jgi:hypothetical protein
VELRADRRRAAPRWWLIAERARVASTAGADAGFMNAPAADRGSTVDALSGNIAGAGQTAASGATSSASRLVELRASAKGWHGVQLAVLGFIGLCGVLQGMAGHDGPHWLQVLAGLLVLLALALACSATALVATAAWPVHELEERDASESAAEQLLHHTARRLRLGIVITFLAVVVLAVGATSSWWPEKESSASNASLVEVTTSQGAACGTLEGGGDPGTITINSGGQQVAVPVDAVVRLRPVGSCN